MLAGLLSAFAAPAINIEKTTNTIVRITPTCFAFHAIEILEN
jgi:hypothetical protein